VIMFRLDGPILGVVLAPSTLTLRWRLPSLWLATLSAPAIAKLVT
jgi:hypothetical protein